MVWAAGSRTMPTCPGAAGVPSEPAKKTRSPGWAWLAEICWPKAYWAWLVRGMASLAAR